MTGVRPHGEAWPRRRRPCSASPRRLRRATARALDAEVTSDTAAQFYDVRSRPRPGDVTVLNRRRLTTTLGLGLYNLIDAPQGDPRAPDLSFRARIRYDADYGVSSAETDATNPANFPTFVPGLARAARRPDVRLRRGAPVRAAAGSASRWAAST